MAKSGKSPPAALPEAIAVKANLTAAGNPIPESPLVGHRWYVGVLLLLVTQAIFGGLGFLAVRWCLPVHKVRLLAVLAVVVITDLVVLFKHPETRALILWLTLYQWRMIDADTVRTPGEGGRVNPKALAVLFTCAVVLTLQEYFGGSDTYDRWFPATAHDLTKPFHELYGFVWWSGWRVGGYVILPMIVIALLPGEKIRDYNLSPKGFVAHIGLYVIMFACFLPVVWAASHTAEFRQMYPFYRMANRSQTDLIVWECIYCAQFMSLEFFFRGFLLQGLRKAFGANAIFVMAVPYCMIHYGKPMPETIGAILAGLLLGTFAMRTKSIWGGILIHMGVAISMDVFALRGCPPMGSGLYCH